MKFSIPGYRVSETLSQSNNSLVLQVISETTKKSYVLKMLGDAYPSSERVARFRFEYHITRRLDKIPGVIKARDYLKVGRIPAMLLEDIGGKSLSQNRRQAMKLDDFFPLALTITKILGKVHDTGVVHKDINPSNILRNPITEDVRLIDFGISSELESEHQDASFTNALIGSLPYISPEQTGRMNREVDYRTDFYSLGVTFYELLTGHLPFQAEDPMGFVHCHIAKSPVHPKDLNPDLPLILGDLILKLMAKNAEDRYQSARGLVNDLEHCRKIWKTHRRVPRFDLGLRDVPIMFQLPQKLYGRERERLQLLEAFNRGVESGKSSLLLITGPGGVGKSALVQEVQKQVASFHGYFIEGKFDQFRRDIPYHALVEALTELVRQILTEPPERLDRWRKDLAEAVGVNARLLVDLIPDLVKILGQQDAVSELNPHEEHNRFFITFREFVRVFADKEHPLVIFLDDLHWSDIATLNLLEHLFRTTRDAHLFIICAYRENEIVNNAALQTFLEHLPPKVMPRLQLQPLKKDALGELVADALHISPEESAKLNDRVFAKTHGNPFFAKELLRNWYNEKALTYDESQGRWQWSDQAIDQAQLGDNVVDFMIGRLRELPVNTRDALSRAACVGSVFTLGTLAVICESSPSAVAADLWEAVRRGMILPLSDAYRLVKPDEDLHDDSTVNEDYGISYRFRHDRLQQAAYALTEPESRPELHYRIGELLLLHCKAGELENQIIEIVHHLNEGRPFIKTDAQKLQLARLNLEASMKAKAATAYETALNFLQIGIDILPGDPWQDHYDLRWELGRTYAKCAYHLGNFAEAEQCANSLLDHVRTAQEKARVFHIMALEKSVNGRLQEAIRDGLKALSFLDITIPIKPNSEQVKLAFERIMTQLESTSLPELEFRTNLNQPQVLLCQRIIVDLLPCVFLSGQHELLQMLVFTQVDFALKQGNSSETAFAYVALGMILGSAYDKLKEGKKYGDLGLAIEKQFNDLEVRCKTYCVYGIFISGWHEPWQSMNRYLRVAIQAGQQCGDLIFMTYASLHMYQWDPTLELTKLDRKMKPYEAIIEAGSFQDANFTMLLLKSVRRRWIKTAPDPLNLNRKWFNEKTMRQYQETNQLASGLAIYHLVKLQLAITFDRLDSGHQHLELLEQYQANVMGTLFTVEICFYKFLYFAETYPQVDATQQQQHRQKMEQALAQMKTWYAHQPEAFQYFILFMEAELAVLDQKNEQAMSKFDAAIAFASERDYVRFEAFAHERAAKYYERRTHEKIATLYIREAIYLYRRWGSIAKAEALEFHFKGLILRHQLHDPTRIDLKRPSQPNFNSTMTTSEPSESLDLETVAKVAQALASEVKLEKLLINLMSIVRESAGASRAILLLSANDPLGLRIKAVAQADGGVHLSDDIPFDEYHEICHGAVQFVSRSHEVVVVNDAAKEGQFTWDPYVLKNKTKSMMCVPIIKQRKLTGILYLENNLATHVFTRHRVEVISILVAPAAISIENALLYRSLEERVKARTQELEVARQEVVEQAHYAGMAEIASGILHNVGNILNSINISVDVAQSTIERSRLKSFARANQLIQNHQDQLAQFLTEDEKGKTLPSFFVGLEQKLTKEHDRLREEIDKIQKCAAVMRDVIGTQQKIAKAGYLTEALDLSGIVEDTLKIQSESLKRGNIRIVKQYHEVAKVPVQRSKMIHILTNLFKNAREAMAKTAEEDRIITVEVNSTDNAFVYISVSDNGEGISAMDLNKIFTHGFTTKDDGQGFGLHTCANYMSDMGGKLAAESYGKGKGATFTLSFPID